MRRLALWIMVGAFVLGMLSTRYDWLPDGLWPRGSGYQYPGLTMPDPRLTPGDVRPGVSRDALCAGPPRTARMVTRRAREEVFERYRIPPERWNQYVIDHLIPVELGGSGELRNLWPQPRSGVAGAETKDRLERSFYRQVCNGVLDLGSAQRRLARDWYLAWNQAGRP